MGAKSFHALAGDLQDAAIDPSRWSTTLGDLGRYVGGSGAILFCTDVRMKQAPCSPNLDRGAEAYFADGWYARDARYRGLPIMARGGVVIDRDLGSEDEIRRTDFHRGFLSKHDCPWFAGVGFRAGGDLWCLSLQRSAAMGPYQASEKAGIHALLRPFADAATLSRQIGGAWLEGFAQALDLVGHAAFICDARGRILDRNAASEPLLKPLLGADGELQFSEARAGAAFASMLAAALDPAPLQLTRPAVCRVVLRDRTLLFRAISLHGNAKLLFSNAAALVLVQRELPSAEMVLRAAYALTDAEVRVALALAGGTTIAEMAHSFRIKPETVRTHLKSVFAKTRTHKQAQLVALIAGLGAP